MTESRKREIIENVKASLERRGYDVKTIGIQNDELVYTCSRFGFTMETKVPISILTNE